MTNDTNVHGIGIINFLKHKTFFVTGSTGFIGKVFVEKLLREVPEVQKVYLLIRAKNAEAALLRLYHEIIDCELFQRLKDEHGERYEEFMRIKLVPVIGNLSDPCLGMPADLANVIADQIDGIINIAGDVGWQGRYDILLDVNVRGLSRLLGFAMNCKKLLLFLHISTAYVATKLSGVYMENRIAMEESIEERQNLNLNAKAKLDIEAELNMVTELASEIPNYKLPTEMAKLGLRRAKIHGWSTTYQLTKAMGEMLMTNFRDKLPLVIIRPSLVESSIKEPISGWIEGYRGVEPMVLYYGKGQLQGFVADPSATIDIVPVDMVVNAMVAAAANHGIMEKYGLYVYHVATSIMKPLLIEKFFELCYNYFTLHPVKGPRGEVIKVKDMEFFNSMDEYILFGSNSGPSNDKLHRRLVRMVAIYQAMAFVKLRFHNKNTQELFEKMSSKEKKIFGFDMNGLDLEDYLMNIHFNSIRKHFLEEKILSSKL